MDWQPISSAPKDGTHVDIYAKRWRSSYDDFEGDRFPNCCWIGGDPMTGMPAHWINLPDGWWPTHWMPLPPPPVSPDPEPK